MAAVCALRPVTANVLTPGIFAPQVSSQMPCFVLHGAPAAAGQVSSKALASVQLAPNTLNAMNAVERKSGVSKETVMVAGRSFEVVRELGRGAFGVVLEAREAHSGASVAVKRSAPGSAPELHAAEFECFVLKAFSEAASPEVSRHVPRYIAHEVSAGVPSVSLAMSVAKGRPVDQWLYGLSEKELASISMPELLDGPLPGGQHASAKLPGAVDVACAFLGQMAPVFETLEHIAYHRDVSAHNFLLSSADDGGVMFTMIDFGLAVNSRTWRHEWTRREVAGDPSYWAPSVWMQFAHGPNYLKMHPDQGLCRQHEERLDHFAFGVLQMEVLFALWEGPMSDPQGAHVVAVRDAWRSYWSLSFRLSQRIHECGGRQMQQELMRSQDLNRLVSLLRALCNTLRSAAHGEAASEPHRAAPLFFVIAELLDPNGRLSWEDIPKALRGSPCQATTLLESSPRPMVRVRSMDATYSPSVPHVVAPVPPGSVGVCPTSACASMQTFVSTVATRGVKPVRLSVGGWR